MSNLKKKVLQPQWPLFESEPYIKGEREMVEDMWRGSIGVGLEPKKATEDSTHRASTLTTVLHDAPLLIHFFNLKLVGWIYLNSHSEGTILECFQSLTLNENGTHTSFKL